MIVQTGKSILLPHKTLKHTNPKHPLQPIMYHSFSKNKNVFIVNCLKFYIGEGNKRMDENQGRQITYESLIRRSLKTLSRYIKGELPNRGIDVTIFQAHSCRVASRIKARQQGIKILESKKGLLLQGKYFHKIL